MAAVPDAHRLSIQQRLYPQLTCFGCGPSNRKGLQLRSYDATDAVIATFQPRPEHDNGLGFLNGGIIATLLDCHSAAAVHLEADRRGWRALPGTVAAFVTAGIDVRFLRPAPLDTSAELRATIVRADEAEILAEVQLTANDRPRASAVATWKRWRART